MRTAYQVIPVAAKSSAECAASESSASEPESRPTIALATVNPPEAAIEVSATRSLVSCIGSPMSSRESEARPGTHEPHARRIWCWLSKRPARWNAGPGSSSLRAVGRDDSSGCRSLLRAIACGFRHGFAIFPDQPRAKLRGRRHVRDAADALSGRPDVLPGTLFVTELELLLG